MITLIIPGSWTMDDGNLGHSPVPRQAGGAARYGSRGTRPPPLVGKAKGVEGCLPHLRSQLPEDLVHAWLGNEVPHLERILLEIV